MVDAVYKRENYKGVRMEVTRSKRVVYARALGVGVIGRGRTKEIALRQAKKTINIRLKKGNMQG